MVSRIIEFFQSRIEIERSNNSLDTSERVPIATCALLLEMAHADSEFSDIEESKITTILQDEFNLSSEDANALIELAHLERKESLDLWQFTNLINEHYSKTEKAKVLETLWRVIYADGKVDKYEEYLIRRLSYLLNMDHKDMIEAKFRAREYSAD